MFHVKQPSPADLNVSRETMERLTIYASLVERWNPAINLFSRNDVQHIWARHITDALQLLPYIPPTPSHAIDLGSGGGIPGLVLAIASNIPFHLIEGDMRKCAFLREAARETNAPATIHNMRIEAAAAPAAPLVTARALAPLPRLLSLAAPFLTAEGVFLAPKGKTALVELTEAQKEWHMRVECFPSATHPAAFILKMSEVRRVGSQPEFR
jgi:16S rRNA (guanine527-N7)-methyltransferase